MNTVKITIPGDAEVLYAVVKDGYGNLISLNAEDQALAQVEVEDEGETAYALAELARLTMAVMDGLAEPLHLSY